MGTLYENIIALCDARGIKGGKLCTDTGISKSILTDLKMGRQSSISTANAQKIAAYFDVPVEYLLTGELPNGYSSPDEENPHTLELCDTFETLAIDDQIYAKNWLNAFAADPEKAKKSPDQLVLTEGEEMLLQLFRKVPENRQAMVIQMIEAALKNL